MPGNQEEPRRISQRSTQGIPPARYQSVINKMSVPRSPPIAKTPSQEQPGLSATANTLTNNVPNLPPPLQPQTSANNSPAATSQSKPKNSEIEVFKQQMKLQMEQMQRQMQAMQNEFVAATQQMHTQLMATSAQVQSQLANLQHDQTPQPPPQVNHLQANQTLQLSQHLQSNQPPPPSSITSHMAPTYPMSMPHKKIFPLPIFTGLPEEWQTFFEAFETTTVEFGYSNLHNIMRLRDSVKDRARETVESLLGSSDNVSAIINTLKETFGRPEQLIRSQIEKVRAIPPLANDDLDALVNFANKIVNMATFLQNANGAHHLSNPSLLSELVSKLSTSRRMQWAEKCLKLQQPATIVDFSNWLAVLRQLANIVHDTLPVAGPSSSRRNVAPTNPQSRKYACVGVAVSKKCTICQGECHSIEGCPQFLILSVEDRWNRIKETRTCFCCLRRGHQVKTCRSKRRCGISGCQRPHHSLLHQTLGTTATEPSQRLPTPTEPRNDTTTATDTHTLRTDRRNCHASRPAETLMFQILPVTLYGANKKMSTYAFIDDGANVSMLDAGIARELELRGENEDLELQWLNEQHVTEKCEKINLDISGVGEYNKKYELSNVFVSSQLSLPVQSCHISNFLKSRDYEKIAGMSLRDYSNVKPTLILSLQHCHLTVPLETPRMLTEVGPILMFTRLGPVIYGTTPGDNNSAPKRVLHARRCSSERHGTLEHLDDMMREYFDIETLGTKANIKPLLSKDDERAMALLSSRTKEVNGRYECPLLWKENVPPIPDSYNMALNRLYSVERKMARDYEYAEQYRRKIAEYVKKGYCRKLSCEELYVKRERVFYLPHFGVINPNKRGIRIVFDAAAEIKKFSLNKALLSGPDINNPLITILFKFREANIAVCGDIEEMFHQIAITDEDQHSQRFLWRNGDPNQPVEVYMMERMVFGATCSPTIAQYVKNMNAQKFINQAPRAVHGIIERHYVDDYVDCFQSESEAIRVVNEVKQIHKAAGFNLRHFKSNSDRVQQQCGDPASIDNNSSNLFKHDGVERVLGIHWLPKPDVFCFELKLNKVDDRILKLKKIPTKREMLSLNMSIFDPFGFVCDYMITAKILMQQVWKSEIQWDEELPKDIYRQWKIWLEELPKILNFSVPRCYGLSFCNSEVELHIFVDASEEAMAAVAYWRVVSGCEVSVTFVMGKTSCAPTRYHTIPKLELQAAVMGVRVKELIINNHIKSAYKVHFWSDSSTVIQWIRSDHRNYKQYVANRVAEILETSRIGEWRWCPGRDNPADEGTRAKMASKYNAEGRWKNGPEFLKKPESDWPKGEEMEQCHESGDIELRRKHRALFIRQVCACVPDFNRFSKYRRLKRAMAWIRRYVSNLKLKAKGEGRTEGELTAEEEKQAEMYLCRFVQHAVYSEEIVDLKKDGCVSPTSDLKTLNPVVDDVGILRVSGRLENATCLPEETRRPIILPKGHKFTRLLVEWYHASFCHINLATTICEIRLRFWVPSLRQLVNSVQSHCQMCRIRRAKPRQPQMAPLPVDRVTPYVRAFSYTGLDYFGPVTVTVRRQREKRWVALFTCLSVRAVHLEIASDLSSDACLMCIRNFVNRRGVPLVIRSDNGTNFVGLTKELQGVSTYFDNNSMTSALTALGVKWLFNTPANPSEGGAWERLVQSVKKALHGMLTEQAPRVETLQSFLIEAENIINSRPLTHLPVTPEEPEPLTPNHFLLGCTNSTQTPAPYEPRLMCLRKQWRIVQNLKNGMWHKWIREYLPELTRRTKWCLPSQPISVGCLVFVCDPDMPRSQWKRGRIVELYTGKDGVARSAKVLTCSGEYKRPISKLAVLDVQVGNSNGESSQAGSVHGGGDVADGYPGRLE